MKPPCRRWALLLVAAALGILPTVHGAVAPAPNLGRESYSLDFWHGAEGLSQSRVRAIVQTRDGYLWLGTDGGLVRFDGVSFTSFTVQSGSLQDNEVWALKEDRDGVLWIGTTAGLSRLENGRFTSYTKAEGLPDDWVRQIDADPAGNLWIATYRGVCRLTGGVFTSFSTKDGLAHDFVTEVCAGLPEGVYAVAAYQLHRFVNGRFVVETAVAPPSDGWLTNLSKGTDGSLWLAFEKGTIKRLQAGRITVFPRSNDPNARGGRILEDAQGNVWLGRSSGLFRLQDGQFVQVFSNDSNARLGTVLSMSLDREGSLWLGLGSDGLARARRTQFVTLTTEDGLPDNNTRSVFQDSRGDIWIGTVNSFACWSRGRFTNYRELNGVPIGSVAAIGEDPAGVVWIGSAGELLKVEDGRVTKDPAWKRVINIMAICRDPQGRMWVGTDGDGLFRFEGDQQTVFRARDGLAGDRVRGLLVDRRGSLWVTTLGGGVSRYADGKFTTFTSKDGLGNDRVVGVFEDEDESLWFATRTGLSRYREGRFSNVRAQDGLYSEFVHSMLDDRRGNFWFSCSQGIFKVRQTDLTALASGERKTIVSESYGMKDGLRSTAFSAGIQPNAFRTADGRLLFTSPKGLVTVDPSKVTMNEVPPPVYVERAQFNRRDVPVDRPAVIPPGTNELEIHYTALGFLAPAKVRFKYRLEGFDSAWVEAGTRRFAHYASLPAGEYHFRVIACNEDGRWNETGATFAFALTPFFYQRIWFHALCLLGFVALVGAALQWRLARLKASEQELQRRVDAALAKVKTLHGLLPICASCKKVRDDKGYWNQIETYLHEHSDTTFSHGVCPDCIKKLYPELSDEIIGGLEAERNASRQGQPADSAARDGNDLVK